MQPKETIEVEHRFARNVDAGPHGVVLGLGVRDHDIQTIGCAALKDHDKALVTRARLNRAHGCASQKAWHRSSADDCEGAVAKENATSDGHKKRSWLLAPS